MLVVERIVFQNLAERLFLLLGNAPKMLADLVGEDIVLIHAIAQCTKVAHHGLHGRLRRAVRQRRDRCVNAVGARLYAFEVDEWGDSGEAMTVQLQRDLADHSFKRGHEGAHAVDGQEPARVLEPDGIDLPALDQLLCGFNEQRIGVHGREAVGQGSDSAGSVVARDIEGGQHIVDVVEPIE